MCTVLKAKRAWGLAISPAKYLPTHAFTLRMSGVGVQICSMGTASMLSQPVQERSRYQPRYAFSTFTHMHPHSPLTRGHIPLEPIVFSL